MTIYFVKSQSQFREQIHTSMGDVHISIMDTSAADFDEYNYNRYLLFRRILGPEDNRIIQLAQSDLFMDEPN